MIDNTKKYICAFYLEFATLHELSDYYNDQAHKTIHVMENV